MLSLSGKRLFRSAAADQGRAKTKHCCSACCPGKAPQEESLLYGLWKARKNHFEEKFHFFFIGLVLFFFLSLFPVCLQLLWVVLCLYLQSFSARYLTFSRRKREIKFAPLLPLSLQFLLGIYHQSTSFFLTFCFFVIQFGCL